MIASEKIRDYIKRWEGLRLCSYICSGGVWTIGYGHTGKDVKRGMVITLAMAERFFNADIAECENQIDKELKGAGVTLTQGQYDAVVSFVFNLGIQQFKSSTLWRKICKNTNDKTIPDEFKRWVYSAGVKLPGLVKRRSLEAKIYTE